MPAQSHLEAKHYMSRGVQTDPSLLQGSSLCDTQPPYLSNSPLVEPAIFHSELPFEFPHGQLLAGAVDCDSAYMQSRTSEIALIIPPLSSLQNHKPAAISRSRPSDTLGPSKRLVSLPNNPSSHDDALMDKTTRVVSMPESGKHATVGSNKFSQFTVTNSSFSTDVAGSSNGSPESKQCHTRTYPLDLPRTPSPPSSPESVMIVGNEPHVSSSFLRRSYTDDDGWITWANSPPRPIPALHGPLSLPYARCPSGAEGTLVEGDDLSHKIWGLGIGDNRASISQPLHSSGSTLHARTYFEQHQIVKPSPFQRQSLRDAVIDISKPSTFHNGVDIPSALYGFAPTLTELQTHTTSAVPAARSIQTLPRRSDDLYINFTGLQLENVWRPNHTPSLKSETNQIMPYPSGPWQTRSGIETPDLVNTRGTISFGGNAQSRLNRSAPVFVPASTGIDERSRGTYNQHIKDHMNPDSQPRKSVFAQLNHTQREHDLPSPPSTSSPRWSPVFFQSIDVELPRKMNTQGVPQYLDPKIYSPHPDVDEYSDKFAEMIQQMANQEIDSIPKRHPLNILKKSVGSVHRDAQLDPMDGRLLSDNRRDLSYHQPRSIPLARLIQRRLSSVIEEDAAGQSNLLPRLRRCDHHPETLDWRSATYQETRSADANIEIESGVKTVQITTSPELQSDHEESNRIIKLPGRPARPSNVRAQRKGLSRRDENMLAKENDATPNESKSAADTTACKKTRTRQMKKGGIT